MPQSPNHFQNHSVNSKHTTPSDHTMWAMVYNGPGKRSLERKPKPVIHAPTDAVVKIAHTTICGTDLHILKGDVPEVEPGRILGHEGVGVIESIGGSVSRFKPGDRVLISCITSDGHCDSCRKSMYSHCEKGGWVLGHLIDGTQAEYVRIPFADTSLHKIPEGLTAKDEEALAMLSDIFPTAYECGVLNGQVHPGDVVAVIGGGPIGLATLITAQFYSPSEVIVVDTDDNRLEVAKRFGATSVLNSRNGSAANKILELTKGKGVDVAVEAVGIPETFELCERIVAPGGRIANIGVHGKSAQLHLEELWAKNITITTRLVDTESTPLLLKAVTSGKLDPKKMITHHFALSDIMKAYDTFGNAGKEQALKVIITNS